ncbi:hypothetical protein [Herminiimonas sp. CN]|uniref:hypothetical protein n=1 Tax=Herminiimonas sp. CN TaxID=1349818 RepID=UPI0012DC0E2F|nr:hypothetical protein [Herminiimonas sp. CN]
MKQQQEAALLKAFQAIFDSEDRQFLLDLTNRIAASKIKQKPALRVIEGGRQKQ